MDCKTDKELLAGYVASRDEAAFTEIVSRHGGMVVATARRIAPGDAEDVAQAAFVLLARNARKLTGHASLAGWLYNASRNCALNARRARARREAHVHTARALAMTTNDAGQLDARTIELIDEALARLPEAQRQVVLLRYVEERSLEATATALALSTAAVAKRAERGLEGLRGYLSAKGIGVSVGALAMGLVAPPASPAEVAAWSGVATSGPVPGPVGTMLAGTSPVVTPMKIVAAVLIAASTVGVAVVARNMVVSPRNAVVATVAATRPTTFETAKSTAESFFAALRNSDAPAVAELLNDDRAEDRSRRASEYVAAFRQDKYAQYPERLATGTNTWITVGNNNQPLTAEIDALSPVDAVVGRVTLSLRPVGDEWRVANARFNEDEGKYAGPAFSPAPVSAATGSPVDDLLFKLMSQEAINPETAAEGDVPRIREVLRQNHTEVSAVLSMIQPDATMDRADLVAIERGLKELLESIDRGGLAGYKAKEEELRQRPDLQEVMGRHYQGMEKAKAALIASEEAARGVPRPAPIDPSVSLKLSWSGQVVELAGPVRFPEWLKKSTEYANWIRRRDIHTFRTRDADGFIIEASAQAMARNAEGFDMPVIPFIRRYRPDGTLAASAEWSNGSVSGWKQYDATGKRLLCSVTTVRHANGNGPVPHIVKFYLPDNTIRIWEIRLDGQTVWWDYLANPINTGERKTIHLVHDNGTDDGGEKDPGLAALPIRLKH